MRACSGTWIAHGSGSADRDGRRRARPRRRAARRRTSTRCGASGSPPRRSRATTTASPTRACGRSATSRTCGRCSANPTGSSTAQVNQRFADAVVAEARSDDPIVLVQDYHFALLPAMIRAKLPRRDDHHLLAHPVAEPGVVRHLPVARARCSRACSAAPSSASTPDSTARTSSRRSTATSRRASSTSTRRSRSTASETLRRELSRSRSNGRREAERRAGRRSASAGAAVFERLGFRPTQLLASASTASTTPRASSSGCTRSSGCSRSTRSGSAASCFVQVAAPTRSSLEEYRSFQERIAAARRAHQRALRRGRLPAGASCSRQHHDHDARQRAVSAPPTSAS